MLADVGPDRAPARFSPSVGEAAEPPESPLRLLDWLPPFILVTGIAGRVSEALPEVAGIALIVVGIAGPAVLRRAVTAKT